MASNSTLVKGATLTTFVNDGTGDNPLGNDTIARSAAADAYYFDNTRGGPSVGDKTFEGFGKNDSLLASRTIFDGNGDGYIVLGPNARLDAERSNAGNAGSVQFNMIDNDGESIFAVRYLGSKRAGSQTTAGATVDDAIVYADAATRINLINDANGSVTALGTNNGTLVNVIEGTVGNDALAGTAGIDYFLYDTALGLNLGGDTITGFGVGDRLVTTSRILNANGNGEITFGGNGVLDLPGTTGPKGSDPFLNPGGQIDFGGTPMSLTILGSEVIDGTTYFYYGFPVEA